MTLHAPPRPFPDFNTALLAKGSEIVRIHSPEFSGGAGNPCKGGPTRFGPLTDIKGDCIPTLYGASTLEAAAFESVFHDVAPSPNPTAVVLSKVLSRTVTKLALKRPAKLALLHSPDLARLGLERSDLIDTYPTAYAQTARWAEAFYEADDKLDGLVWTSRRCDPALAFVFFESRLPADSWQAMDRHEVNTSPDILGQIRLAAQRANILLTL